MAAAAARPLGLEAPVGVVEDLGPVAVGGDHVDHGHAELAVGVEQRYGALDERGRVLGRQRERGDLRIEVPTVQVDGHDGRVFLPHPRLDAPDDAGASAVGDRRRLLVVAEVQDRVHVLRGFGVGDEVGRARVFTAKSPDDVAVGLAQGVCDPVVALGREHRRELLRRLQARLGELNRLERDRLLDLIDLEAEPVRDRPCDSLDLIARGLLVLVAPAPPGAAAVRGLGHGVRGYL